MSSNATGPVKPWLDRMLEIAVTLVVIGLLLDWAWQLISPLIPVIAIFMAIPFTIGLIVTIVRHRNSVW